MDLLVTDQLERGLRQRGCVICRIGDEAARHYLGSVLHEYVNDLTTRTRLAASWGFCPRHGWGFLIVELARCHDGMSTANLAQWQVQRVLGLLRRPAPSPTRPSPLHGQAEIQARFRRTRGLRLPHFRETLSQVDDPPTSALLLEVQARSVRQLARELEAFRQACDHRHVEPPSDRGVWQRVLDLFAGTRGGDAA